MLTGVYRPTDGGIRLDGQNLIGKKPHEICKLGVARTFQNIRLFSQLSVLDNVKTGLHNQITYSFAESMFHLGSYRKKEKQMDEKAMELLRVFDLDGVADYKGGKPAVRQAAQARDRACARYQPQAAAARRACRRHEPERDRGADGDDRNRPQKFGVTVLLIEHDMKLVSGICEYLYVLNFGRLLAEGTPKEVLSNPEVVKAYLGE